MCVVAFLEWLYLLVPTSVIRFRQQDDPMVISAKFYMGSRGL